MSDVINWFERTCGSWRSERRYLYGAKSEPFIYTTMMDIYNGDRYNQFVIKWTGQTSGEMRVSVEGDMLIRDRDYFGKGAHNSKIEMLNADTIVLRTSYGGVNYVEEISLRSLDSYRLRQTLGTKDDHSFALCGQYVEFRL